jgi:hypothetical protein
LLPLPPELFPFRPAGRLLPLVLLRPPIPPPKLFLRQLAGRWLRRLVLLALLRPPLAAGLLVSRPAGRWLRPLALSLPLLVVVCPIARACALE